MTVIAVGQRKNMTVSSVATIGRDIKPSAGRSPREHDEQVARWIEGYVQMRQSGRVDSAGRRSDTLAPHELKARIVQHHTPLVESIARRFVNSGEPQEDLVQEGFLGLLSALEHYETTKGVKFSTYATHFVAGAIRHCLRDRGKIIKEPAWLHEVAGKVGRASDTLTQQLGRAPHAGEIAALLNLTEEAVEEIQATRQIFQVAAFDSSPDDGSASMAGLVDPEKIRSDRYVTLKLPIEDRIALEEAALKLKALEQKVLFEFFYQDLNQTEIAKKFGISCNYVSHILKNSTGKLKRMMGEAEVRDRTRSRESSVVDAASELYTQAHILARAREEISRAARFNHPVALLVATISIPSGQKAGEAWAVCGQAVRKSIRKVDIAGRLDNNRLLIVLPQTGEQGAVVVSRLFDRLLTMSAAQHIPLNVHIGMAIYPDAGRSVADLIALAEAREFQTLTAPVAV